MTDGAHATEEELTAHLATTIQQAVDKIEAWGLTENGQLYLQALTSSTQSSPDSAFAHLKTTLTAAIANVIADGLTEFGLVPIAGMSINQIAENLIALANGHLSSSAERIKISNTAGSWTPLGFAFAQQIAASTQPSRGSRGRTASRSHHPGVDRCHTTNPTRSSSPDS